MFPANSDVVICGAGLAGASAAYHLAVQEGVRDILIVDQGAPLSLTSDKSTECYRNWWPGLPGSGPSGCEPSGCEPGYESAYGAAMVRLVDRSIDIMEGLARESGNIFHMNRRGYVYLTGDESRVPAMLEAARGISALGAGPLRTHTGSAGEGEYTPLAPAGFEGQPEGADFITDRALLRQHFPYLSGRVAAALHVRRAGWLSAQQLGAYLLEQARERGARLSRAKVTGIELAGGRVASVRLATPDGEERVGTRCFVDAAGPLCGEVARLMGVELPVFAELHAKVSFHDTLGAVPREAPLLIWNDPQRLAWNDEERAEWAGSEETRWLLDELPGGAHTRPEGGPGSDVAVMLWAYHTPATPVAYPPAFDPCYAEVTLRGLAAMLPAMERYFGRLPKPVVDGGYYLKTRENRPLICPLPVEGAYLIGALSGFGLMSCCAAGELVAAHVTGRQLPVFAPAFRLERYEDPAYRETVEKAASAGQL